MSEELKDEEAAIKAIYGDGILNKVSEDSLIYALKFPSYASVSLRIEFPHDYPDAPPSILGTQTIGGDLAKGNGAYFVDLAREVLSDVYVPQTPCIYDFVEEVGTRLQQLGLSIDVASTHKETSAAEPSTGDTNNDVGFEDENSPGRLAQQPPWAISEVITEKKSVFVARCASVASVAQAQQYLSHLLASDKKVARATHSITAWRIQGQNGVQYQDCDDDGETAAGGRVLHLMELMKVWNVMVVVTRWYGGVQLGPDRFRLINHAARDALVKGGFTQDTETKDDKKKTKR